MTHTLKPYSTYKSSGVEWLGEIPVHWAVRRLKLSVANSTEQTNKRHEHEIYLALEHVESWTGRYSDAGPDVVFDSQVKRFRAGDVLFGKLRPYLAKVVRPDRDGVCVGEFLVLRPRGCAMSPNYLKWLLRTKPVINAINASTYGTKMPRTNWQFIGGMKQPLPPLPEQAAIARYLDYVERRIRRYIDAKQKLVGLLEELKQATIYEAVTRGLDPDVPLKPSGVEWLGHIPTHWEMRRGKWMFRKMKRPVRETDEIVTCFRDGVVTLRRNRRTMGFTESLKEIGYQGIRAGDLVIHAMDAFAGAVGVADADGKSTPVYSVCRPEPQANVHYYAFVVREMARSQWILALATGIRERSTDFRYTTFATQLLPLPPLPEQEAIAEYLNKETTNIDTVLDGTRREIELLQEYRTVLIADVVSGQVDVRDVAANLPDDADDAERRDERDPFLYAEEHAPDC